MNLQEKTKLLIASCDHVTLASLTEEGFPRPCIVSVMRADGYDFYISTGTIGKKTAQFLKNPKGGACFVKGSDSVTMTGRVTVSDDLALKKAVWRDWMREHFPGGPEDPNYCLLKFSALEATVWIGGEFKTFTVAG